MFLKVKSSTESLETNSNLKSDFFGSSVLTGANYQPTSSYHEATGELQNQNRSLGDNLGFWVILDNSMGDKLVLGISPACARGISRLGSSTVQVTKEEFQQRSSEGELYECKDAAEEGLSHSEDSEEEGRSWSSGEE